MTIDKFGRTLKSSSQKDQKGPKGEGYKLTDDGHFDIDGKRLTNVGEPIQIFDAVTKTYVDSKVIPLDKSGFNIGNKRVRNVNDPIHGKDAVNLQSLKKRCINLEGISFNAENRQIINLSEPVNAKDAATKEYVEKTCNQEHLPITTNIAKQQQDLTTLKGRIAKCESLIAVNKEQHEKSLRKFGTLLFKYINHKQTGRSAILPTAGEGDYLNWEKLFEVKSNDDDDDDDEIEVDAPLPGSYGILMSPEEARQTYGVNNPNTN